MEDMRLQRGGGAAACATQEAYGARRRDAFTPLFCKVANGPLRNSSNVAEVVIP
jgi:hypothetical protein